MNICNSIAADYVYYFRRGQLLSTYRKPDLLNLEMLACVDYSTNTPGDVNGA